MCVLYVKSIKEWIIHEETIFGFIFVVFFLSLLLYHHFFFSYCLLSYPNCCIDYNNNNIVVFNDILISITMKVELNCLILYRYCVRVTLL